MAFNIKDNSRYASGTSSLKEQKTNFETYFTRLKVTW